MKGIADHNVFLILIKLALEDANPMGGPVVGGESLPRMEEGKKYALIAGLLDPSQQTTRTPLTPISFSAPDKQEHYNRIIGRVERLVQRFYQPDVGFLSDPSRLDANEQEGISHEIRGIGRDVFDLLPRRSAVWNWLDDLFSELEGDAPRRAAEKHVTIITNDFNIPWYWMRVAQSPLLCEACSLGMLQLSSRHAMDFREEVEEPSHEITGKPLHALLIKGAGEGELPFMQETLESLSDFLRKGSNRPRRERPLRPFEVKPATRFGDIVDLLRELQRPDRRVLFRLVHYSGHWNYDNKEIAIGADPVKVELLHDFIDSAVLALDGCSSSHGLQAWSEMENLTGKLLNLGALGCVVTALPVKDDPIAAKVFWEALYSELLAENAPTTLGQALVRGRRALKQHFGKVHSKNPAWAFYQLIGNPSVRLVDEG